MVELKANDGSTASLADRLAHVLWLGGAACSGKSTIAVRLAERHGLRLMRVDDLFESHWNRTRPDRHVDFAWLARRPFRMLWAADADPQAELLAYYESEFDLLVEDLLERSADTPLLVEGAGLLPARVAPLLRDRRRAVWLFTSAAARRRRHLERSDQWRHLLASCVDPPRAYARWMDRDDRYAEYLALAAERHGLAADWLDEETAVGGVVERVERRLGLV